MSYSFSFIGSPTALKAKIAQERANGYVPTGILDMLDALSSDPPSNGTNAIKVDAHGHSNPKGDSYQGNHRLEAGWMTVEGMVPVESIPKPGEETPVLDGNPPVTPQS